MAALALAVAPAAEASPVPPFDQHGRWILDAKGRVVVLHGVNMVNKLPPYRPDALGFGVDDIKALKREGFNTVRLGIIYKGLEPQRGQYDDAYLARILRTAKHLQKHGVWPLVDFHQDMYNERFNGEGFPDWAVDDDGLPAEPDQGFPNNYFVMAALWRAYDNFFDSDDLTGAYAKAWAHVADRFRAERGLIGFDIFNEPFPGSRWKTCANPEGCPVEEAKLTALTRRVFGEIRKVNTRHILWWEPWVTFDFGANTHHGDPNDERAGMSYHPYCILAAGGTENAGGPNEGCTQTEERTFEQALVKSEEYEDALLASEFGATDNLEAVGRVVREADQYMASWQYWAWWNEDTCCKRPAEGIIRDLSKPPTPDNLKQDKLNVLVRPYPQAVAGTPERWSFDPATRVFELAYSLRPAGGKRPTYTPTEVFVPRRHYPKGYSVEAKGARVVSKPNAQLLLLRAKRAAGRVEVRVSPR